jgi:2-polyprenyl-6-methoxyphenol hydroxylase-like FAD-dependent oxidoreductase
VDVTVLDASPHLHAQAGGVIGLEHISLAALDSTGVSQHEFVPFTSERVVAVKVADRQEADRTHTFYPGRSTAWHLINTALLERLPEGWLRLGSRVQGLTTDTEGRAQPQISGAYVRGRPVRRSQASMSGAASVTDSPRTARPAPRVAPWHEAVWSRSVVPGPLMA